MQLVVYSRKSLEYLDELKTMGEVTDEKQLEPRAMAPSVREDGAGTSEISSITEVEKDEKEDAVSTSITPVDDTDEEKQAEQPVEEETPPRDITGWRWIFVVFAILSSIFLFALDDTIVADIQPEIVVSFNSIDKLTWISVAFLVSAASTNLVFGKIYSQFNGKWTYIAAVAIFEVGSAICGAAPTMDVLIVGRAICGLGGVGMYVGVMSLLAATTTIHERPTYVAGTGLIWGLGTVLGPVIGGAFTDSPAGWRWAFYINLCIGGACAPVYLFMLPSIDPRPGVKFIDRLREMDWLGTGLTLGAFSTGVSAISLGGVAYPWNSSTIIGLFCGSGVLFILLGLQQVFLICTTKDRRMFPIEFMSSRTLLILFATTAAGGVAIFVPIFVIPLLFQFTRNDSALESGIRLLPFVFFTVFFVIVNGIGMAASGYYMPWYLVGGIITTIGGALMFTVNAETSTGTIYGFSILVGVGVGMFCQASFSVAQAVVDPAMVPNAVGFITCGQVTGITIGIAICSSLFLNKSETGLQAILPGVTHAEVQSAIAGANSALVNSLPPALKAEVIKVLMHAMSWSYILIVTAGSVVVVLSLLMKRDKLFLQAA